ncbi:hypothetical protein [Streptomyces halobius]|uniref:Rho termination factor-like protein n=1 Tax=Streptomyces halobius TaxID=2879846 RepID=A0ABY4MH34_9ACTN|nr:hypothetical protein [Streptomyces halobius]UQA97115.1 hypothetical protein K9S39_39300 [Streptomyces halobius]
MQNQPTYLTCLTSAKLPEKELKTAVELVEALDMEWHPEEYRDIYRERVLELVEAKAKGETYEKAEPPPQATSVVDLTDVLQKSVDRAGSKQRKGRAGGKQGKGTLERLNKKQLHERAADADIPGRSSMNRDELIEALGKAS